MEINSGCTKEQTLELLAQEVRGKAEEALVNMKRFMCQPLLAAGSDKPTPAPRLDPIVRIKQDLSIALKAMQESAILFQTWAGHIRE